MKQVRAVIVHRSRGCWPRLLAHHMHDTSPRLREALQHCTHNGARLQRSILFRPLGRRGGPQSGPPRTPPPRTCLTVQAIPPPLWADSKQGGAIKTAAVKPRHATTRKSPGFADLCCFYAMLREKFGTFLWLESSHPGQNGSAWPALRVSLTFELSLRFVRASRRKKLIQFSLRMAITGRKGPL